MSDWTVIRRLQRLIFDDLGYPMAWAIERTKRAFSEQPTATFTFDEFYSDSLDICVNVERTAFAAHSEAILTSYREAVNLALERAGLKDRAINVVFLTGGTSQLPFIRHLFTARFGEEKLRSADSFTSVCEGLALSR